MAINATEAAARALPLVLVIVKAGVRTAANVSVNDTVVAIEYS